MRGDPAEGVGVPLQQRHRFSPWLATSLLMFGWVWGHPAMAEPSERPAVQYARALLGVLDHLEAGLDATAQIADSTAARLVGGGALWVAFSPVGPAGQQSFAKELYYRAGGLAMVRQASAGVTVTRPQDVLLVEDLGLSTDITERQMQSARSVGTLVILFGSATSPLVTSADAVVTTGLGSGTVPVVRLRDTEAPVCPLAPPADIAAAWVFTGELVAACTRRGQMPAVLQSVVVNGSLNWNAKYNRMRFHDDLTVAPVAAGQLGRAYLAEIRRCVTRLREQADLFAAGGQAMADTRRAGGTAWAATIAHHVPGQFGLPGDPGVLDGSLPWNQAQNGDVAQLMKRVVPGDALAYVGYYGLPAWSAFEPLRALHLPSVWITGGRENPGLATDVRAGEIHIDPGWTFGDCAVVVPGYPIGILPPSGVVQTAALWMITGETAWAMSPPNTAIEATASGTVPVAWSLQAPYPNPFNPTTTIRYELAEAASVRLRVYAVSGQFVRELVSAGQQAGAYHVVWDGRDNAGVEVSSGAYLARLEAGDFRAVTRMVLMK